MRSLYYPAFDQLELRDVPPPQPAPGEVLLKVAAVGICGSELESFKGHSPRRPPPLIMGHEFCGTVVAVTDGGDENLIGRHFVSNSLVSCGTCASCQRGDTHLCPRRQIFGMHRPGAFAEYAAVPKRVLLPWPDTLPAAAACLAEPLANGVHIVNLTRHLAVERALIIGAGPIGLMCQQALQAMRSVKTMVCDLSAGRLEVAQRLGATHTVRSHENDVQREVARWTDDLGVDLVVDAVGAAVTKRLSLAALRPGGAAVWIGLHGDRMEIDSYEVTLPERQILGTYSARMDELATALDLMTQKKVDVTSWTQSEPIEHGVEAFHRVLSPGDNDIKAILTF
jgi:threonine dehydrogenase-like Zn-dependent dehydrogenase